MKKLIFALIASATAFGAAQAQEVPRGYVGAGIATVDHSFSLPGTVNGSGDGYKASGKLFGGYEFNQTWGVEAGYTDFRKSTQDYTLNGVPGRAESDGSSVYLAAKASTPLNEQFSAYGKLGAAYNKRSLTTTTAAFNRDENKTEVYAGLGVQYNLSKQVALTAEYERYGKSKDFGAKADVWTVGARYNF
jgi:opacity protein-like surface antigen